MPDNVTLISPEGTPTAVPADQVAAYLGKQFRVEGSDEHANRLGEETRDANVNGVDALGQGIARAATLGLSDVAQRYAGGEDARLYLDRLKGAHPYASGAGEVVGSLLPGGVVGRVGGAVKGLREAGIVGGIAAGAIEGGAMGLGSGVSELALSDDPLNAERIGSTLSSSMLFAGGIGGVAGGLGKLAEKGLAKAKGAIEAHMAESGAASAAGGDGAALVNDLAAMRSSQQEQKLWLATKGSADSEIRSIGKQTLGADRDFDRILNNPKALAENPKAALTALQKQEHALERLTGKSDEIRAGLETGIPHSAADIAEEDAVVTIRAKDLEKRGYFEAPGQGDDVVKAEKGRAAIAEGQRDPVKATVGHDGKIEITDGRNRMAAAIEADAPIKIQFERGQAGAASDVVLRGVGDGLPGASSGARAAALDAIPQALEQNRALQVRARALMAGPPEASKIEQLAQVGLQGALMHGVAGVIPVPIVGHAIGAYVAKKGTDLIFGRLGAAVGEGTKRTSAAVSAFIGGAEKAIPHVPVLATKVLSRVRYAPPDANEKPTTSTEAPKLDKLYLARAAEIRSQVATGPDGVLAMRPEARQAMAARISPIRAHQPLLADQMETVGARRLVYLAGKLEKRPDLGVMQTGPDTWKPSELGMRTWARHAAAVEDPGGVEERLAHGTITPEDAEAYNAVYPERAAHLKQLIIEQLPTLKAALPYKRRLALSIFAGVPVDAAMAPSILHVLQSSFTSEPGTEGGMQAPKASPQFGSVKKSVPQPTPADTREQGAQR